MSQLNARAKAGLKALFGRQIVMQLLTFGGGVVMARLLSPAMFGVFTIANAMVAIVAIFGDCGLSAALIQRKGELTDRDIQVGFTLQQVLLSAAVTILLFASPWIARLYPKAPPETVWLVRALAFNLYLSSWRSISVLQLERRLEFGKVAKFEVAEQIVYQVVSVTLAAHGLKVWSFVIATLARGVVGTVMSYAIAPWPVRFAYDREVAKSILSFGVPMQLNLIFLDLGSWVTPLVGGQIIGPAKLGYVSFASANGKKPLMIVDSVMRAAFPHLSRLQDDMEEFSRLVVRYLTILCIPTTLWFVLMVVAGRPMVQLIYTSKFVPAVTALSIFAASGIFETFNWVGGVAQDAAGLPTIGAKRSLFRSIVTVAAIVPMAILFGFNAIATASLIVGLLTLPWSFAGLPKGLFFKVVQQVIWLTIPVTVGLLCGILTEHALTGLLLKGLGSAFAATLGYGLTAFTIGPKWFKELALNWKKRQPHVDADDLSRAEIGMMEYNEDEMSTPGPSSAPMSIDLANAEFDARDGRR